jgi:hypothetical protein
MKFFLTIAVIGVLVSVLFFGGCTSSSPSETPAPVQTPAATTVAVTPSPTPTSVPYPDALPLNAYTDFGSGTMTGSATVYRYLAVSEYNWTAPSFNSPHEQAASSGPFDRQYGFNNERPKAGNTFLFIFVRVSDTGTKALYAPSAQQFVVYTGGKTYNYSPVHSSDVTINGVSGTQYDFQIGRGGEVGYILPGDSNSADGYLIYEVPASFSPDTTYVLSNLDYKTQVVWKLG